MNGKTKTELTSVQQMYVDDMNPAQRAHFWAMVNRGEGVNLSVMCALQQAPVIRSETSYMNGFDGGNGGVNGRQFEHAPEVGDAIVEATRKHDPNFSPVGKVFLDQLVPASEKRNPAAYADAWADRGEVRSHIKKVCEKRGWGCSGSVSVKPQDVQDTKPYRVADDLVKKQAKQFMAQDSKLKKGDALAKAREKLTPKDLK